MKLRSNEILQAYMKDKNLSVQQLADYSGCSKSFIGFLRTGHKTSCTPELADRIARALGAPLEGIFEVKASAPSGRNAQRKAA